MSAPTTAGVHAPEAVAPSGDGLIGLDESLLDGRRMGGVTDIGGVLN